MKELFETYLFLIPLIVLVASEATKVVVESWKRGFVAFHHIFHPGGFPSTHSAFVTSLLIIVDRVVGAQSLEFAIAFVFACVVWYDAMGVRKEVGEQARVLNVLQKKVKFWERAGHSFSQVISGITFGAVVTWLGITFLA
jgi:acid phosphatase family membrane protein YuiD